MSQKYADIIIDISHEAIDRTFQYKIPEELSEDLEVGMVVCVPFGQGNRRRKGYVIEITEQPSFDVDKMKEIEGIPDRAIRVEGRLIQLAAWMRDTYGSTMINALKTVMPVKETVREVKPRVVEEEYFLTKEPVLSLSEKQRELAEEFSRDRMQGENHTYLLHGITGSGKTEVYIACIREIIKENKQAIVLIPEIGLTYQNVARFKQHFGERVALINSRQSKGEKYREFMKAKKHEVDVIIGPRSALFTPCQNLGLIIIDEEHDDAYKSEQSPKYHARNTALERARLEQASVILGSATPSMESYVSAKLGEYKLWELSERPEGGKPACISVVDMREELRLGNRSMISKSLYDLIGDRLEKNEQIMLFMNKRGYHSFVSCRECGEVVKCPKCDVSLSLHNNGLLMCHYCGYVTKYKAECPKCHSKMIGGFGTGTQKIEQEIKRLFPEAKTLRMDKDTTARKGAHGEIINRFIRHEADILIGTQMIVKGHDFENVTLVGIMLADISLFANDYRAGERTFDLLTQAAGRAGRGNKTGDVLIQTYQPEHYAIMAAAKQDYKGFFEMELTYRRLLGYPPACHMMVVLVMSEEYEAAKKASEDLAADIKKQCKDCEKTKVTGAADAGIARIKEQYRRVIYVKTRQMEILTKLMEYIEGLKVQKVSFSVDVDPVNSY